MNKSVRTSLLTVALYFAGAMAMAGPLTVVAPSANQSANGNTLLSMFDSDSGQTVQWAYAASQFSAIPVGTEITSIGFRLQGGGATITLPLIYMEFDIEVSTPAFAISSLSSTFASNQGADEVTVLSGPLTIPGGSFVGGPGPNPFYDITFTTPFVYPGGDLLFTIVHSSPVISISPLVDANTLASLPAGLTNTVFVNSATETTGTVGFFNSPVTQLDFVASVPEPATLALLGIGLAGFGYARKRKP